MGRAKEFEEEEVLSKALDLFWERGYQGTSIQDLVDRTGVQRTSLYSTFGSKHDLFLATLDSYYRQQFQLEPGEGLTAIRRLLRKIAEEAVTDCRGCYIVNVTMETAERDPEVQKRMLLSIEELERGVLAALQVAKAAGEISSRPLPPLARLLVTTVLGLRVLAKARASKAVLDDVVAAAIQAIA